jgi:hypothetical protein
VLWTFIFLKNSNLNGSFVFLLLVEPRSLPGMIR